MNLLHSIFGAKSYPLNKIYLSREKLISNYQYLSKLNPNVKVAPVLKSNAYGHGIELVGKMLDSQKPPFICVDSLPEAYQLKKAGVKSEILIMGRVDPRSLKGRRLPFSYTIFDREYAKQILRVQPHAKLHLFVDTGMHREGSDNIELMLYSLSQDKKDGIKYEGLMSHFAMPRKPDSIVTKTQFNNFAAAKKIMSQEGFNPKWFHIGGTYSLTKDLARDCNVIRCGKGLYGFGSPELVPILSMTTTIIQWKQIKKGDPVGYDATFTAPKDMTLAILPIGYNDGVDRRLSNSGIFRIRPLIRGITYDIDQDGELYADCPVVGRVSMNITTIDITQAVEKLGDKMPALDSEIEIISADPKSPSSVQNIADLCHTIPEDIFVHLNASTRREVV